jgi:hypothetical protein
MKAVVVIAHHGHKNDEHLERVLAEWAGMKDIRAQLIVLQSGEGRDPLDLPFEARRELAIRLPDADLFVYSEDDMLITERNMRAWCALTAGWIDRNEVAGFMRYELRPDGGLSFPDMHGSFRWMNGVEERAGEKFAEYTNLHQGCYLLMGWQLRIALASGGFLVPRHTSGPYGMLECGASDPFTQCNLRKRLCVSRFDELLIHHLPDNYLHLGTPEGQVREQLKAMGVEWAHR